MGSHRRRTVLEYQRHSACHCCGLTGFWLYDFCDVYLELSKLVIYSKDAKDDAVRRGLSLRPALSYLLPACSPQPAHGRSEST
jgi:valyl-tRNA synthetase